MTSPIGAASGLSQGIPLQGGGDTGALPAINAAAGSDGSSARPASTIRNQDRGRIDKRRRFT